MPTCKACAKSTTEASLATQTLALGRAPIASSHWTASRQSSQDIVDAMSVLITHLNPFLLTRAARSEWKQQQQQQLLLLLLLLSSSFSGPSLPVCILYIFNHHLFFFFFKKTRPKPKPSFQNQVLCQWAPAVAGDKISKTRAWKVQQLRYQQQLHCRTVISYRVLSRM